MDVCFAARTDIGRRRQANEDFFAVDERQRVFVVADGLGGHAAGRTASEVGVSQLVETLRSADRSLTPFQALRCAFRAAHEAILGRVRDQPELRGMGTTLVVLWVRDGLAVLGHVGDSRIYLLRSGSLHPLTFDHSLVSELVLRGQLTPAGARTHPHRHVITRALGVGPVLQPDTAALPLEAGDTFALCTDGITGTIEDPELRGVLADSKGDLALAAWALVDAANRRGGDDNSTVVLVSVG